MTGRQPPRIGSGASCSQANSALTGREVGETEPAIDGSEMLVVVSAGKDDQVIVFGLVNQPVGSVDSA